MGSASTTALASQRSRASAASSARASTVTGSKRAMPRTTSAHSSFARSISGPKTSSRQGHETSVRSWSTQRAGSRRPSARGVAPVAGPVMTGGPGR